MVLLAAAPSAFPASTRPCREARPATTAWRASTRLRQERAQLLRA